MTAQDIDALDLEIAEGLGLGRLYDGVSIHESWWLVPTWIEAPYTADDPGPYASAGKKPPAFSHSLDACAVMRARLDALNLAEEFACIVYASIPRDLDDGSWRSIFEVLGATAEQQALAAREVLRGWRDQPDPLATDAERDVPDGDGAER